MSSLLSNVYFAANPQVAGDSARPPGLEQHVSAWTGQAVRGDAVYRTGFDRTGFISEVRRGDCPEPVQRIAVQPSAPSPEGAPAPTPQGEPTHAEAADYEVMRPRRTNQLRLF